MTFLASRMVVGKLGIDKVVNKLVQVVEHTQSPELGMFVLGMLMRDRLALDSLVWNRLDLDMRVLGMTSLDKVGRPVGLAVGIRLAEQADRTEGTDRGTEDIAYVDSCVDIWSEYRSKIFFSV